MSVFEGSRLLRGQPGSKVVLTVIRGNAADPHQLTLVREKPPVPPVSGKLIGTDTGYIRIASFRDGRHGRPEKAGGGPVEVRRQEPHHRHPAHRRRAVRERHCRGAALREVRDAGAGRRPGSEDGDEDRGKAGRRRDRRSGAGCSSRPARPARRKSSPPRSTATSVRTSSASTRSAAPGLQKLVKLPGEPRAVAHVCPVSHA